MIVEVFVDDLDGLIEEAKHQNIVTHVGSRTAESVVLHLDRDSYAELELTVEAYGGDEGSLEVIEA